MSRRYIQVGNTILVNLRRANCVMKLAQLLGMKISLTKVYWPAQC